MQNKKSLNHLAIIMDGNGRWALNQDLPRTAGHAAGEHSLSRSIDWAIENKLEWLTVYAFSTENWLRSDEEVEFLMFFNRDILIRKLVELLYKRRDMDFKRGSFRAKGDVLEIFPSHHEDRSWKISFFGDDIEKISEIDPLTGENLGDLEQIRIFANSHYVTPKPTIKKALVQIKEDLKKQLDVFEKEKKLNNFMGAQYIIYPPMSEDYT